MPSIDNAWNQFLNLQKKSNEEPGDASTEAAHCFIDHECGRCTYFFEKL